MDLENSRPAKDRHREMNPQEFDVESDKASMEPEDGDRGRPLEVKAGALENDQAAGTGRSRTGLNMAEGRDLEARILALT